VPPRWPKSGPRLASLAPGELALLPSIRWDGGLAAQWSPGEESARRQLVRFRRTRLRRYASGRDRPGEDASSRLSPHLHFGEISPRQVLNVVAQHAAGDSRAGSQRGGEVFLRELGWREFAHHLLFHFPWTAGRALDPRFDQFPWRNDARLLRAWQSGRTGIPLVDAGMRELWQTGWMHNRARMIVASFLTKHLRTHWLAGARWFWDTLVDADLANNTLGWQWTAGCGADAAPYFRVFNPLLQAKRFDPDGHYVRHWVPELRNAKRSGTGYPGPIVDLAEGRAAALAAYETMRRHAG
jgi:deoxyribodipyrimidine photo-lyase